MRGSGASDDGRVRTRVANTMQTSPGMVSKAKGVKAADPEKFKDVKAGKVTLSQAEVDIVGSAIENGTVDQLPFGAATIRRATEVYQRQKARLQPGSTLPAPTTVYAGKPGRAVSSAYAVNVELVFGNPEIAEAFLADMKTNKKVLHMQVTELAEDPRPRYRTAQSAR